MTLSDSRLVTIRAKVRKGVALTQAEAGSLLAEIDRLDESMSDARAVAEQRLAQWHIAAEKRPDGNYALIRCAACRQERWERIPEGTYWLADAVTPTAD